MYGKYFQMKKDIQDLCTNFLLKEMYQGVLKIYITMKTMIHKE